jgi:hypothetical protein
MMSRPDPHSELADIADDYARDARNGDSDEFARWDEDRTARCLAMLNAILRDHAVDHHVRCVEALEVIDQLIEFAADGHAAQVAENGRV